MNLMRMSQREYEIFRYIVNFSVFTAFLLTFIFVELKMIKQKDIITTVIATLVLASLLLLVGLLTITPEYSVYAGKTFMVFSVLMIVSVLYRIAVAGLNIFSLAELILAILLFLYGRELKSGRTAFISLKALTG